MKKFLYFQTATDIEGTDTDEEAIMVPADSLIMIEPTTAVAATMTFEGKGIGEKGDADAGMLDTIEVELAVTAANFEEFCRQISKFINADILNRDNSAYSKDGMLVVANSNTTSGVSLFHSTVTACNSITVRATTA